MAYPQADALTLAEARQKFAEAEQIRQRNLHEPANLMGWMDALADQLVALDAAATDRAECYSAVAGLTTTAACVAALESLV